MPPSTPGPTSFWPIPTKRRAALLGGGRRNNVYVVATYADQASLAPKAILGSVLYDYGALVKQMVSTPPRGNSKKARLITWGLPMASADGRRIPALKTVIPAEAQDRIR